MKHPKTLKRYCPKCDTRTEHKVSIMGTGHKRGTLKRGSLARAKSRGAFPGTGNKGRYSRRPPKNQKMKSKTTTRKVMVYKCSTCKKSTQSQNSRRVGKLMLE